MKELLMDTHIWLWFALKTPERLSKTAVKAIDKAAMAGKLKVSIISIWEIGLGYIRVMEI